MKLQEGINDLATWCKKNKKEYLLSEWDDELNDISPYEVTRAAGKKVWWKCSLGHSWKTAVCSRTAKNPTGCPYCSGTACLTGYNDFETWCKENDRNELLLEWDYEKNEIIPASIAPHINKKVWWRCDKGHEWEAAVGSRTGKKPCGCPYCAGRLLLGNNDFETWCKTNSREDLLIEWSDKNELQPNQISAHNQKKIWWKCSLEHEWMASVNDRTKGNGCPYCSGRRTLAGYNDFETWCKNNARDDLLSEWGGKNAICPQNISPFNNRKVWWKCSLGHEWQATIGSRTGKRPSGCPYCSVPVKKILVGFNDFETKCKEKNLEYLLQEWNVEKNENITPQSVSFSSGKRIWWKCKKGHEWKTAICDRIRGTNCPICSRTSTSFPEQAIAFYLAKNFNILQRFTMNRYEIDVYLEDYGIGIEYDGLLYHSSEKAAMREKNKDVFFSEKGITILRMKEDINSKYISKNTVFYIRDNTLYLEHKFNDALIELFSIIEEKTGVIIDKEIDVIRDELKIREHYATELKKKSVATLFPELIPEWDVEKNEGMTPDLFAANSHTKVWWKCLDGHSWQATIASRNRGLGCPFCAGQRTLKGVNDLESWGKNNNPTLLQEWNYEKNSTLPADEMKTSNKKVWWKCAKGHEWKATIANRVHGTRCPLCFTGKVPKRKIISLKEWCVSTGNLQLLKEWNEEKNGELSPADVPKGGHLKVWWKCEKGHEWEAQIKSRTYNHGCPYCSSTYKKALVGVNDLVTWCRQNGKEYIIDEWDYTNNDDLKPEMFTQGSHKRINWVCSKGHKWSAVIKERTKHKGNMCPMCREES